MLATASNDRQTKFWARNRLGNASGLPEEESEASAEVVKDEMELGNHVGIVIGKRGATIISMQRATGTKMHVEGTVKQIETVKKRVGALLERVSNEDSRNGGMGGHYGPAVVM
jgi:hypothetical protein